MAITKCKGNTMRDIVCGAIKRDVCLRRDSRAELHPENSLSGSRKFFASYAARLRLSSYGIRLLSLCDITCLCVRNLKII